MTKGIKMKIDCSICFERNTCDDVTGKCPVHRPTVITPVDRIVIGILIGLSILILSMYINPYDKHVTAIMKQHGIMR
jgi:hypothetical protein